jgi:hypothetical protein
LDEKSGSTYPKDQHFVLEVTLEDFEVAKTRVRPSAMREVSGIVLPELTAVH